MTIKELMYACKIEIAKGNGDKEIWLSNDDEGNGFHQLFYEFTDDPQNIKDCFAFSYTNVDEAEIANAIILG